MNRKVLLVGASGQLGSCIARKILAAGAELRAMTRRPGTLSELAGQGAQIVIGDMMDPASLARVMDVDQVVTTANSFMGRGRLSPKKIDHIGNRNLIDAAKNAGVGHFLFMSAKVPDAFRKVDYFHIKAGTERYLQSSGITSTILRPTAFLETWGHIVGDSIRDKGKAPVFGPGARKVNYIAIDDVASVAAQIVSNPPAASQVVEIGGPNNLTAHELIDILAAAMNKKPQLKTIPLPVLHALGSLAGLLNAANGRKMKTAYATATAGEPFDFAACESRFPIKWTSARDWAMENYGVSA